MAALTTAAIALSRTQTVRHAPTATATALKFVVPAAIAVPSAVLGWLYGAVLWTRVSQHQERRLHLTLDRHTSLLYRLARFSLGMLPARADEDDWMPEWVTAPPAYGSAQYGRVDCQAVE